LKRPWPLANVSGCVMGKGKCHQAPCADSNYQLPVAGVYVQKKRPPLSKQSRGKSTLKSSRWSKILTHLEMRLPSGGHERRSRWSRAVSAPHFFLPFFALQNFRLILPVQLPAPRCCLPSRCQKVRGKCPSPKPLCLSQPLHAPGPG